MLISILHRITGVVLAVGAVMLVVVLASVAIGPEAYEVVRGIALSALGQLFLMMWTMALFLHSFNGLRHLVFDAGYGFGIEANRNSGIVVLIAALLLTVVVWMVAWFIN